MVALTLRTWHGLMLLAQLFSIVVYILSLLVLKDYFGEGGEERGREGKERKGKERKGKEREGKGREGKGRKGKERNGRKGKERKERKGKERREVKLGLREEGTREQISSMQCCWSFFTDGSFLLTLGFLWKTVVITAASCIPLFLAKFMRQWCHPPSYAKLLKQNSMFRNCCKFIC